MMKERGVHEGVMMLRALAADNAFVWGLVNVSKHPVAASQPFFSNKPLTTSVTQHSLRQAKMHLQQLDFPAEVSMKKLESYTSAVAQVFASAPPGSVPGTMVADAGDHLNAQYAATVRSVRAALLEKGGVYLLSCSVFCAHACRMAPS
jgi:hypothetical protein